MRRVALLLLVLPAIASASAAPSTPFQAAQLDADEEYALSGVLDGFMLDHSVATATATPTPAPAFRLEAPILRVEVDATSHSLRTGVVDVPVTPSTTPHNHTLATLRGVEGRPGLRWFLLPQEAATLAITVDGQCGTGNPATNSHPARTARVRATSIEIDTTQSSEWTACGDAEMTVHGDMLLVLWETDVAVQSTGGNASYWSGARPTTTAPWLTQDQELWIYALNATLTLSLPRDDPYLLALGPETVLDAQHIRLRDVDLPSHARQARLADADGNLTVAFSKRDSKLAGSLAGVATLTADGQPLEASPALVASIAPAQNWPLPWLAVVPAVILAAMAHQRPMSWFRRGRRYGELPPDYTAFTRRHRRAAGYMVKAQEWLERGRLRRAAWASGRSVKLRPENVHHQILRVSILDEQGRNEAALKNLQLFYDRAQPGRQRAVVALEVAASLAKLGRRAEAEEWLQRAAEDDPATVADARGQPYFQAVHGKATARAAKPDHADPGFA